MVNLERQEEILFIRNKIEEITNLVGNYVDNNYKENSKLEIRDKVLCILSVLDNTIKDNIPSTYEYDYNRFKNRVRNIILDNANYLYTGLKHLVHQINIHMSVKQKEFISEEDTEKKFTDWLFNLEYAGKSLAKIKTANNDTVISEQKKRVDEFLEYIIGQFLLYNSPNCLYIDTINLKSYIIDLYHNNIGDNFYDCINQLDDIIDRTQKWYHDTQKSFKETKGFFNDMTNVDLNNMYEDVKRNLDNERNEKIQLLEYLKDRVNKLINLRDTQDQLDSKDQMFVRDSIVSVFKDFANKYLPGECYMIDVLKKEIDILSEDTSNVIDLERMIHNELNSLKSINITTSDIEKLVCHLRNIRQYLQELSKDEQFTGYLDDIRQELYEIHDNSLIDVLSIEKYDLLEYWLETVVYNTSQDKIHDMIGVVDNIISEFDGSQQESHTNFVRVDVDNEQEPQISEVTNTNIDSNYTYTYANGKIEINSKDEEITQEQMDNLYHLYGVIDNLIGYVKDIETVRKSYNEILNNISKGQIKKFVNDLKLYIDQLLQCNEFTEHQINILSRIWDRLNVPTDLYEVQYNMNKDIQYIRNLIDDLKKEFENSYTETQLALYKIHNAKTIDECSKIIGETCAKTITDQLKKVEESKKSENDEIDIDKFFNDYETIYNNFYDYMKDNVTSNSDYNFNTFCIVDNNKEYTLSMLNSNQNQVITKECRSLDYLKKSLKEQGVVERVKTKYCKIIADADDYNYQSDFVKGFIDDFYCNYTIDFKTIKKSGLFLKLKSIQLRIEQLTKIIDITKYNDDYIKLKDIIYQINNLIETLS